MHILKLKDKQWKTFISLYIGWGGESVVLGVFMAERYRENPNRRVPFETVLSFYPFWVVASQTKVKSILKFQKDCALPLLYAGNNFVKNAPWLLIVMLSVDRKGQK